MCGAATHVAYFLLQFPKFCYALAVWLNLAVLAAFFTTVVAPLVIRLIESDVRRNPQLLPKSPYVITLYQRGSCTPR